MPGGHQPADVFSNAVGQQFVGLELLLAREVFQPGQEDAKHPDIRSQSQRLPFFTSLNLEVDMPVRLRMASLVSRQLSTNTSRWSQQMNRPMPACTQGFSFFDCMKIKN